MPRLQQTIAYACAKKIMAGFFSLFYRVEYIGLENVPLGEGHLLAANHASFFDPPVIGCNMYRDPYYFARKTLFKPGLGKWTMDRIRSIPVDRDGGSDVSAFKKVFKVLKEGNGLVLFPEGTRTPDGEIKEAQPGVGLIACKAQVPVVPVHVYGSFDAFGRHAKCFDIFSKITVIYGQPIPPAEFDAGKKDPDRYQKAADIILDAIKVLKKPCEINV